MRIADSIGMAMMMSIVSAFPSFAQAPAEGGSNARGTSHVRGLDAMAVTLLDDGVARSATFKRLVDSLETHEVIVWVTTGFLLSAPGQLTIVGATGGWRLLRITISNLDARDRLLAHLAHELQHAMEIAAERTVVDAGTLRQFYFTHGNQVGRDNWCTSEAQKVRTVVALELGRHQRP